MFQRILVVCVGNICRSPTAEIMLRRHLPMATVSSAGLHALTGRPMDDIAREVLEAHGLDGSAHIARQLDADMLRDADLVLAMERAHVEAITRQAPQARGRTFLLGKWQSNRSVPDPYRQQRPAFEHVHELIAVAVDSWIPYLKQAS
ncbi:MAG TPA: low molecular weight protein-tyrosine-phosphatase [Oleiagrimonas sp.]|nr:low molecular weight protein-tyrosine-phosphatase [Oleiagrimonas sp.]